MMIWSRSCVKSTFLFLFCFQPLLVSWQPNLSFLLSPLSFLLHYFRDILTCPLSIRFVSCRVLFTVWSNMLQLWIFDESILRSISFKMYLKLNHRTLCSISSEKSYSCPSNLNFWYRLLGHYSCVVMFTSHCTKLHYVFADMYVIWIFPSMS